MIIIFSAVLYNAKSLQDRRSIDKAMFILAASIHDEIQADSLMQDVLDETHETFIPYTTINQHYVEVTDNTGSIVLRSNQLGGSTIPFHKEFLKWSPDSSGIFESVENDTHDKLWEGTKFRILYYPFSYQAKLFFIIIAVPLANLESTHANLRLIFFISIPLMLLAASVIGWFFSKGAYKPVRQMIQNADAITAENLSSRIKVNDTGDELQLLAITLNNMISRLEASFTALKQFSSDASHELRTPLTILRGQVEVALGKRRDPNEYEKILKESLEEVVHLQSLVDELLMLSRLESGRVIISNESKSIIELITDTVSRINSLAKKKNINIILHINAGINSNEANVYGDYTQLQMVFFNILENAIKYSDSGSEIHCSVSKSEDKNIKVEITDKGIGMSDEVKQKIFERFYRADSSRTRENSLSLGLAIAYKIIELHKGKIEVESREGTGSTFTVILPQYLTS
jgi:two-component system OmpR family sensor kinase